MFKKPSVSIVSIHSDNITYIERFNKALNKTINPNIMGATENKKIYASGKWTGTYRQLICFEYNPNKPMQFCFFTTGEKDYHSIDDPRFFFFYQQRSSNSSKLRVDNPIWIPTHYLKEIKFDALIQSTNDQDVKDKLNRLRNEYRQVLSETNSIWKKYQIIKYKLDDQPIVIRAHEQMIARDKASERFCKSELELIEQSKYKNM